MTDPTVLHINCPADEKAAWLATARVAGQPLETWVREQLNSAAVDTSPAWLYGLSERTRIGLIAAGYCSREQVADALSDPGTDLAQIPNFGRRCVRELEGWIDG